MIFESLSEISIREIIGVFVSNTSYVDNLLLEIISIAFVEAS